MEPITYFLLFWFACYGAANGIAYSRLLLPFRLWVMYSSYKLDASDALIEATPRTNKVAAFASKLVGCPMCLGFWLGMIFSLGIQSPTLMATKGSFNLLATVFDGFFGSAAAWISHLVFSELQFKKG